VTLDELVKEYVIQALYRARRDYYQQWAEECAHLPLGHDLRLAVVAQMNKVTAALDELDPIPF
jgi:hypothetical protein